RIIILDSVYNSPFNNELIKIGDVDLPVFSENEVRTALQARHSDAITKIVDQPPQVYVEAVTKTIIGKPKDERMIALKDFYEHPNQNKLISPNRFSESELRYYLPQDSGYKEIMRQYVDEIQSSTLKDEGNYYNANKYEPNKLSYGHFLCENAKDVIKKYDLP